MLYEVITRKLESCRPKLNLLLPPPWEKLRAGNRVQTWCTDPGIGDSYPVVV